MSSSEENRSFVVGKNGIDIGREADNSVYCYPSFYGPITQANKLLHVFY